MTSQSSSLSSPRQFSNSIRGGFRTISLRDDDENDNTGSDLQQHLPVHHRDSRRVPRESITKATEVIHDATADDFNIYPVYGVTRKICHVPDNLDMDFCTFAPVPLQHPDTRYVAVAKGAFDEGNERYVYRFFEVAYDGKTTLGCSMVAKESRRVATHAVKDESKLDHYVLTFCKTQQLARHLAVQFNRRLYGNPQQMPRHFLTLPIGSPTVSIWYVTYKVSITMNEICCNVPIRSCIPIILIGHIGF